MSLADVVGDGVPGAGVAPCGCFETGSYPREVDLPNDGGRFSIPGRSTFQMTEDSSRSPGGRPSKTEEGGRENGVGFEKSGRIRPIAEGRVRKIRRPLPSSTRSSRRDPEEGSCLAGAGFRERRGRRLEPTGSTPVAEEQGGLDLEHSRIVRPVASVAREPEAGRAGRCLRCARTRAERAVGCLRCARTRGGSCRKMPRSRSNSRRERHGEVSSQSSRTPMCRSSRPGA